MSRWKLMGVRVALMLASVWLAFMIPRWLDSSFYDQCPTWNCFRTGPSAIFVLVIGMVSGLGMNIALTALLRARQTSA